MQRLTDNRIVLIKRKTRLEELVARFNTVEQARFYIEHLGSDFSDYIAEDTQYKAAILRAETILDALGRLQTVSREHVSNLLFGSQDIVVAIGQDGLVANTLKYLSGQPLVGVNPDPARWDGVLLPFLISDLRTIMMDVFSGRRPLKEVTMAKAALNDGQVLYAVNDLFVGQKTHVSSRYHIRSGNRGEDQSSSGIIVSTGLGATGWFKGIVTGAAGIAGSAVPSIEQKWDVDYLRFSVREPFPSKSSQARLIFGRISDKEPMSIISHMPENGVIFSDGIESDYLEFGSGVEAVISVAEKKGHLVV